MSTAKLDEKGRIVLPADLIARLKMSPGDEFVIGEATSDSIHLKKKDLRTILEGVIEDARKIDLDKLERCPGRGQQDCTREAKKRHSGSGALP